MKIRLVLLGSKEYEVQFKHSFWDTWSGYRTHLKLEEALESFSCHVADYTAKKNRKIVLEVLKQVTI